MPTSEEIDQCFVRLKAHRRTLAICLQQRAVFTAPYLPPSIAHNIIDARESIKYIKQTLRHWGVDVEDHLDDIEEIQADVGRRSNERLISNVSTVAIATGTVFLTTAIPKPIRRSILSRTMPNSVKVEISVELTELPARKTSNHSLYEGQVNYVESRNTLDKILVGSGGPTSVYAFLGNEKIDIILLEFLSNLGKQGWDVAEAANKAKLGFDWKSKGIRAQPGEYQFEIFNFLIYDKR